MQDLNFSKGPGAHSDIRAIPWHLIHDLPAVLGTLRGTNSFKGSRFPRVSISNSPYMVCSSVAAPFAARVIDRWGTVNLVHVFRGSIPSFPSDEGQMEGIRQGQLGPASRRPWTLGMH